MSQPSTDGNTGTSWAWVTQSGRPPAPSPRMSVPGRSADRAVGSLFDLDGRRRRVAGGVGGGPRDVDDQGVGVCDGGRADVLVALPEGAGLVRHGGVAGPAGRGPGDADGQCLLGVD